MLLYLDHLLVSGLVEGGGGEVVWWCVQGSQQKHRASAQHPPYPLSEHSAAVPATGPHCQWSFSLHTLTHTCFGYMNTRTHTHMYAHTHTHIHACTCVCVCVCVHVPHACAYLLPWSVKTFILCLSLKTSTLISVFASDWDTLLPTFFPWCMHAFIQLLTLVFKRLEGVAFLWYFILVYFLLKPSFNALENKCVNNSVLI